MYQPTGSRTVHHPDSVEVGSFDELCWCLQIGRRAHHRDAVVTTTHHIPTSLHTAASTAPDYIASKYLLAGQLLATRLAAVLHVSGLANATQRQRQHVMEILRQFECGHYYQKLLNVHRGSSLAIPIAC